MTFWKPGKKKPGTDIELDRETQQEGGFQYISNKYAGLTISQQRQRLPIYKHRTSILYAIEKYRVVVIVGETGCGKTTQLPQYLYEAGWCSQGRMIGCTQPRRVAALSVAQRVAEEQGKPLGSLVGYAIRFEESWTPEETRIKYMTDGMLLREMMLDPLLNSYSVIMVDEAHERSLHTDIIVGLLKKIMKKRKDLRLIISSATLQAEMFKEFFETNLTSDKSKDTAFIMSVEGRMYPVNIYYTDKPVPNYIESTIHTILQIHKNEPSGDILAFLTGQDEIDQVITHLNEEIRRQKIFGLIPLPLYSGLPIEQQMKVFEQTVLPKTRKVIVSTNIAETSVTIDGIVYVIDCGFVKQRIYNPKTGMEALIITEISQGSALQRAGRAGRVRSGNCYRLYTEEAYHKILKPYTIPEIQRSNLSTVVLQLKALGIDDVLHFDFISPPPSENMIRALELLYALGALDDYAKLTDPLGQQMAEFPVDNPNLSKMLLVSGKMGCSEEALTIAAMLSVQTIFLTPRNLQDRVEKIKRKFAVMEGDHITMLNVFDAFSRQRNRQLWCQQNYINFKSMNRVVQIRKQLKRYLKKFKVPIVSCKDDLDTIRKCVVSGYFSNAAQKQPDGSYKSIRGGQIMHIHPSSVLFKYPPEWVVFTEVIHTTKEYMRDVMSIDPTWLPELAPHFYELTANAKLKELEKKQKEESNKF